MMDRARAFTLIQMVFVVVLLALVAAGVSPRYSHAGVEEARMDDLCSRLQLLRSQIELYKIQHDDCPPMRGAGGTVVFDSQLEQMLYCTDREGRVKTDEPRTRRDQVHPCGPYLKQVPVNPFNKSGQIVRAGRPEDIPVPGGAGWAYIPEKGEIYANDSAAHAGL